MFEDFQELEEAVLTRNVSVSVISNDVNPSSVPYLTRAKRTLSLADLNVLKQVPLDLPVNLPVVSDPVSS